MVYSIMHKTILLRVDRYIRPVDEDTVLFSLSVAILSFNTNGLTINSVLYHMVKQLALSAAFNKNNKQQKEHWVTWQKKWVKSTWDDEKKNSFFQAVEPGIFHPAGQEQASLSELSKYMIQGTLCSSSQSHVLKQRGQEHRLYEREKALSAWRNSMGGVH